jgi:murein DD-endopeptidase MepM/ murein hydrolase activator NlpD
MAPAEKPRAVRTPRRLTAPVRIPKLRAGRPTKRALLSKLMSVGAMIGAAAMMVATTVPANAFYSADTATHSPLSAVQPVQTLSIPADANTASAISRDTYTVSSPADEIRFKFGSRSFSYTNDPSGTIQWPFAVAVPISSGFGARSAPCGGCSSYHEGLDFVPGAGAPIQSIADGVVSLVDVSNSAYGNHVVVDHVINGQKVQSVYAHMRYGSVRVAEGQQVKVGDILGLVGNTGESTGPHLHLEIHLDGVPVDPFAWLKANAN